jgi:hypothetical protein
MQHLILNGPEDENKMLKNIVKKNLIEFCFDKYGSHVTEKSITYGTHKFR